MTNPIIKITNLKKSYNKNQNEVLKNITLDINRGEIFGILGLNGVGKSTLIKCITGIHEYDSGDIIFNDLNLNNNLLEVKKQIGCVFDSFKLYESMTGKEYLDFIKNIYNIDDNDYLSNFEYLTKCLMIENDINRYISEYSHGMKQKISLIASYIHHPLVWILDEPNTGLDIVAKNALMNLILKTKQDGRTVIIISHDIDVISKLCDRVGILSDGEIKNIIAKDDKLFKDTITKIIYGDLNV